MDEGFTATAYPKVQENLKLTVEEHVILKEPASSTGTLSSQQHLTKDLSFGDLFFNDKPSKADNEKTTAETKVESMVGEVRQSWGTYVHIGESRHTPVGGGGGGGTYDDPEAPEDPKVPDEPAGGGGGGG
nr:hypothetical protein [Tanacetum cinerariifolium]